MGGRNFAGFPHIERLADFMASSDDYASARAVLWGIGQDFTTSYRPGTRFGPVRIREASYGIEEFSYHSGQSLTEKNFFDLGDVAVVYGDVRESLARAEQVARRLFADGKLSLMMGGEHLVTLPVVKAAYERYGDDLVLLQFDAHADLREEYLGNPLSHATVMRRCLDFLPARNLYQFGIRSGTREEYEFGMSQCHLFPHEVLEPLRRVVPTLGDRPVYVTIDIDVMDPAFAPGTGTPEPGGITSREMIDALLAMRGLNVVALDVVEVAPGLDPTDRTPVLAAKLLREAILAFG
ncbi:MAG: agmatinase [Symbiobacterium sp.]|uniref:agmatinase n=1 Tax=Symbiobacterium sp. TaxID=1971213 RepID=UPI003463C26C